MQNSKFRLALSAAKEGAEQNELPVGCALFYNGILFKTEHNKTNVNEDPLAHCELLVLREFIQTHNNVSEYSMELYVTLEPCVMCYRAYSDLCDETQSVSIVFGAYNEIFGMTKVFRNGMNTSLLYRCIESEEAVEIVREFYKNNRNIRVGQVSGESTSQNR
ncbi:TADA [Enterospora canceri]|uniref:TADA n=1 Tax=Enterospora canceri TaxID=1081671 RepID=A0A1Y1S5N6_9MICR|nr:TADA [Enterospora canceri]